MFVLGGSTPQGRLSNELLVFDGPLHENWGRVMDVNGTPPPPIEGHTCSVIDSSLHIATVLIIGGNIKKK